MGFHYKRRKNHREIKLSEKAWVTTNKQQTTAAEAEVEVINNNNNNNRFQREKERRGINKEDEEI